MKKGFRLLSKYIALALYGISTFTLYPSPDYTQHISSPEQMTRKSWEMTGNGLRSAIDNFSQIK